MADSIEEDLHGTMGKRHTEKVWWYRLRSSKRFVIAVISIAIFTVGKIIRRNRRKDKKEIGLIFIDGSSRMYFYMGWWGSSQDTIRNDTMVARVTLLKLMCQNRSSLSYPSYSDSD
jgi:hypothetical protein